MKIGQLIAKIDRLNKRMDRADIQPGIPSCVSYKVALPPEKWPQAEQFLRMMVLARDYNLETGERPEIDLRKLVLVFANRMRKQK